MNQHAVALKQAIKKLDTPKRERPKPCNGVKESHNQLLRRINWLRDRAEESTP